MDEHVAHFEVLFTAQKLKKFKTWQDGTMKYYSFNKKLVLTDEKGYNIDRKFSKTGSPSVGDEVEFDGHIVTVESFTSQEPYVAQNVVAAAAAARAAAGSAIPAAPTVHIPMTPPLVAQQHSLNQQASNDPPLNNNYRSARKRLRTLAGSNFNVSTRSRGTVAPLHEIDLPPTSARSAAVVPPQQQQQQTVPVSVVNNGVENRLVEEEQLTLKIQQAALLSRSNQINSTVITHALRQPPRESRPSAMDVQQEGISMSPSRPADDERTNRAPSIKRMGKRPMQSLPIEMQEENESMEVDNTISESTTSLHTVVSHHQSSNSSANIPASTTPINTIQNQQQPPLQRRVRMGLSKRTNNALHSDYLHTTDDTTTSTTATTISASSSAYFSSRQTGDTNGNNNQTTSLFVKASAIEDPGESSTTNNTNASSSHAPKPFKVPLVDGATVPPVVLQFPSSEKALALGKSRNIPKRTKTVPSSFRNSTQYREVFQKIIHEHLQILLLNYSMVYYMFYKSLRLKQNDSERNFRSKGIGFYASCELQSMQDRYRLQLRNREHHSKYSKDDIWVISKNPTFDPHTTFLSRSTYYGPFSDGYLEVECLTARDARVATSLQDGRSTVYALRTISASTEFLMLDSLQEKLDKLPLLPFILCDDKKRNRKKKDQEKSLLTTPVKSPDYIMLTSEDNISIEHKLQETIERYHLNEDQQSVLRQVAKSVIVAPNWNDEPDSPITLVHGVFGSGKSYLAAVLIIFLRDVIDTVNAMREPDDLIYFRILIYSMTNVAVDRILISLEKLGYDSFIRIGSLKKIAKSILPYTIRAKMSSNEEQMLEDPQNSEEDIELIASTIQKFRKSGNTMQLQSMDVVGTTCMASTFDIFGNTCFSLALVDEASQLTEPLSMLPLVRFTCSRLIMIGDPLQLPPTVTTSAEEEKIGQGLDKTLFDRLTECHPRISCISNQLFYSRQLQDGVSEEDRKPLIEGLPNLMFVDVGGQEQRNARNNSFWNETEASIATHIIEGLLDLDVSPSDIGIISLYKEQADKLMGFVGNNRPDKKQTVQISTVDAFQGGEKEVIILSTVRTTNSTFIDNYPRVNVALTRARRHLIILGKQNLLLGNNLWANIVMQCQDNSVTGHDCARLLKRLQHAKDSSNNL
ncbi:P-loop containing nucleoside triphosphate hydrolase protein [Zychaea mexicana]|uniref:P-loop containing nucleoside triphosphate hydrolase protein n=1 Tax=Zychaea mexicana TaxID=64656 RepID=UPI0022FEA62D|nr:P-loop containing nucleoside triphosphate hydrolase protein [Zychaea mexicana]KAI9499553.1 P-loop containing nucleoside triphosphate hydrolase protein [Zychaea mexicana]